MKNQIELVIKINSDSKEELAVLLSYCDEFLSYNTIEDLATQEFSNDFGSVTFKLKDKDE